MLYNYKIGYVRKDDREYEKLVEKFWKFIRKIFFKVKLEYVESDVIFLIPKYKKCNGNLPKIMVNQIKKYMRKLNIDELLFEEELDYIKEKFDKHYISTGKMIMKKKVLQIFEHIFKINRQNMNLENVYVLVNEYNKQNTYIINKLAQNFRTVNIITENIRNYKKLENYLYKDGILITVSNNKRKSLKNAKYIVNIDFDKNKILMYNINPNSIILNLIDENINLEKGFNGVLINNFEIKIDEDKEFFINEFYGNISKKIFLETIIKKNIKELKYIENVDEEYDVKISELIGIRGKLENGEFLT